MTTDTTDLLVIMIMVTIVGLANTTANSAIVRSGVSGMREESITREADTNTMSPANMDAKVDKMDERIQA